MKEVVCWCCEYFEAKFESPYFRELITSGVCKLESKNCELNSQYAKNLF